MTSRPPTLPPSGPDDASWRSLDERTGAPEAEGEFPPGASQLDPISRRSFLQLAGGTLAVAGLSACYRTPTEKILPYTRQPPQITPGLPLHYATAMTLDGYAVGLLAQAREGRPVKLEGNPDHPASLGASGARHQATLLQLFDPDRARSVSYRGQPQSWLSFQRAMLARVNQLAAQKGARLRLLLEPTGSPLLADLRARLLERFPEARFVRWAPAATGNAEQGARLAFGQPLALHPQLAAADVVVALDADFLDEGPDFLRLSREFARRRDPAAGPMNRLYVIEPALSPTGTLADHRLRLRPSQIGPFALALAAELAGRLGDGPLAPLRALRPQLSESAQRFAAAVAADLAKARGRAAILVGEEQPPEVHALAHAMHSALGSLGQAVRLTRPALEVDASGSQRFDELAAQMRAGEVDTLFIGAFDPVYAAPADLDFAGALEKVPNAVYHGLYPDATGPRCSWIVPATHLLETWGDARAFDGTVSLVQPLIAPISAAFTESELLATLLGEAAQGAYGLLRSFWSRQPGAELQWENWLAKGVVPGTALAEERPEVALDKALPALKALAGRGETGGLEVRFVPDRHAYDGRFSRNAWLQELPEPITKLTWDNAAWLSPATARQLGVQSEDVVRLRLEGREVEAPAQVVPGHADGCVTLTLGYGRAGPAGEPLGYDAYRLRSTKALGFAAGLELAKAGRQHPLAHTQRHFDMLGRPIALARTLDELKQHPEELEHLRGAPPSLYEPFTYETGHKWGMSVDMSRCTSCSACVIACQSENNIPSVGKQGVLRRREMHWLRVDRYFFGSPEDPTTVNQPMFCVHCEKAPCEYVCPVNATVHSDEGLNEMVYNRCVGTRYCSNNCPYKVRRFNYLAYNAKVGPLQAMRMNPEVTVRSRGVMEKCTYCVQRIERARIDARTKGGDIAPDSFTTACAQACPTEALVFGDLNAKDSRVRKLHDSERRYDVLHEVGTRPRTGFLVRVRNPNPELA